MTQALYALTGDPIHFGHLDIIERAAKQFDGVRVLFAKNSAKQPIFSLEERVEMAKEVTKEIPGVTIDSDDGLLVDYAVRQGIDVVVKGMRRASDFEHEHMLFENGYRQQEGIETVVLFAHPDKPAVSSSETKMVLAAQGDISGYVPMLVKQKLEAKQLGQYVVGLTGIAGSGKSYVGKQFEQLGEEFGVDVHNVDLDHLVHDMYRGDNEDFSGLRQSFVQEFGDEVLDENGTVNRRYLGGQVLGDENALEKLNGLVRPALMARYRQEISGKQGLVLYNAALIAEHDLGHLCNNDVVVVDVDEGIARDRVLKQGRDWARTEAIRANQFDVAGKEGYVLEQGVADGYGHLWKLDNGENSAENIRTVFEQVIKDVGLYES